MPRVKLTRQEKFKKMSKKDKENVTVEAVADFIDILTAYKNRKSR